MPLVATTSTAVSFVPTTAAVVVVIVTTTIAHISGHPALLFTGAAPFLFNFGVLAVTLLTVRKLILVARASAAVTLIPSTCTIVVFVIASTVASVIRYTTFAPAISFGLVRFVFALALLTVGVLVLGTTDTTAIAPIVFASAVVIVVIAVSIADPCGRTTCAGAATVIMLWIKTLAFRAVNKLVFVARCTTAIPAVPTAATVVVIVVTTTIFFVFGLCTLATTLAFRRFWWRFCRWGLWILTFAFLAVRILPFLAIFPTAITSVVLASAVVVVVIAVAIADIVRIATLAFTVLGEGSCKCGGSFGGKLGIQAFATCLLVAVRVLVFIA